ncbi:MAG: ATP-binding protein [Planctomycetota bacterium]|jgi:signal transduction histidine kinase|nr:ATP-binding protein [Planctomycetota bacterium]
MKRFGLQFYLLTSFILVGAVPTIFLGITQILQPKGVQATLFSVLAWSGFALLLAAVFGAYLSARFLRPILNLTTGIEAAAGNDFTSDIDISTAAMPKEVAELTDEFNQMIHRLQDSYSNLEQKVTERTSELAEANQVLEIRNQQILDASRAKGQFLANMSHELRTPLNAIIGFSQMLQKPRTGELNTKQSRYVSNVLESGQHLLSLVNDILDLSKIEAAKLSLEPEEVNLQALVCSVTDLIQPLADKKDILLTLNLEQGLPEIVADDKRVRQILFNLLSNAVKFTESEGKVELSVSHSPEESRVRFSISDTGIGISEEDLEHIWDEFHQIDDSYAKTQEGTGLGLSLTRKLVALHQGSIDVTSEYRNGSTFTVELPVAPRPVYVLVVEDKEDVADLFTEKLEDDGFEVITAQDTQQGIREARQTNPDLIFLDLELRGRSGFELLKSLQADPVTSQIPVIVMAANEMKDETEIQEFIRTTVHKGDFTFQKLLADVHRIVRISA